MNKKIKKIPVLVSIIIIILGIILGVGVSNNIINSTNSNLYVDGKDFSDIVELTSFIGSKVLGFVIVIYSILLDYVIWIVYEIIIFILKLLKKNWCKSNTGKISYEIAYDKVLSKLDNFKWTKNDIKGKWK